MYSVKSADLAVIALLFAFGCGGIKTDHLRLVGDIICHPDSILVLCEDNSYLCYDRLVMGVNSADNPLVDYFGHYDKCNYIIHDYITTDMVNDTIMVGVFVTNTADHYPATFMFLHANNQWVLYNIIMEWGIIDGS